uniref:BED-type domain-containing protein n=1 Tax=Strongyloides venezuelensis TaxID=75913 RepID=A0A0K0G1F5_STRVS
MDLQTESTKLPRFDVDSLSHLLKMEKSITLPSAVVNPKIGLRTRPVPSPRFHSKISEVWKHYHMPDPTSFQVICFHCGKRMKRSDSSTKSMWGHLKAFHKDLVGQETFDMKIRKRKAVRNEYNNNNNNGGINNNNNNKNETTKSTSTPRRSPSSNGPSGSSTSREDTENDGTLSSPGGDSSTVQKLFLSDLLNRMAQKTTNPLLSSATCGLNDIDKTTTTTTSIPSTNNSTIPLSNDKMNLLPLDLFSQQSSSSNSIEVPSATSSSSSSSNLINNISSSVSTSTNINTSTIDSDSSTTNNMSTTKTNDNETSTTSLSQKDNNITKNTPTQPYVKRNRAGGFQNPYGLSAPISVSQGNPLFNSGSTANAVDVFAQIAASQMKTASEVSGLDFKNDPINNFLGTLPLSNDISKIKDEVVEGNGISATLGGALHGMSKNDLDEPLVKKLKASDGLDINGLLGLQNNSFMLNKLENQHNVNEMLGQLSTMNPFIFAAAAINQSGNVGGGGNLLQQLTSQSNDISKITGPFANGLVSPPKQQSTQSSSSGGSCQSQQQTSSSSTPQGQQVNGVCQQQSSSSTTTTTTPSGSVNFSLTDNSCIQSLISIAKDMNIALTYASDTNNIDEFTLSCKGNLNVPNFVKKSVVLKDFPDEIKIFERNGDGLSESEAWRKTEWSQMQWALRGKVQNILFK